MADNVIDTLSININSSSTDAGKSINGLIRSLEKLDNTLSGFASDSSQFSGAMKNLSSGFEQLNSTLSQLDTAKLQSVANSISSLSNSVSKLNSAFNANGIEQISALAYGLSSLDTVHIPDLSGIVTLAANISKLGGKKATAGVSNLPLLVNGLRSLNGLSVPDIPNLEGLANLISTINRLGGKKGNNASANIRPIIDGLRQLSALQGLTFPDGGNILSLANAFSTLGRETTGRAIQNIPQLATAFKQLMQTLSTAPRVSKSVIALAQAMASLASQGAKVGSASRSMSASIKQVNASFEGIMQRSKAISTRILDFGKNLLLSGHHAESTGRRYETLASKIGLLYAKFWVLLRAVRALNGMISVASSLIEVQNVVDTTFGKMSYKIEEFSKNAIKDFGMTELSVKQYASRFQAMGTSMGITGQQVKNAQQFLNMRKTLEGNVAGYDANSKSMADMSINLTKLTSDLASFYDVDQSVVAGKLASGILANQSRPLRDYGINLTDATLKEWALSNGLKANIKDMSQAEKAMLRYQYVMANTTRQQGDFARTSQTWHNQVVILKQQLQQLAAVIGSGLIQAIKPFVIQMNAALSGLIKFAQNVVNALGKIFGWEMEVNTKGLTIDDDALENIDTSGLDDIGDSADNATKSVKKLKDQLQGFDKLNVLRTTTTNPKSKKSGSGNGSGASGTGAVSNGDVTAGLKKTKGSFESDIDNLFDLGESIANTISKKLEDIKWEKVYEKARKFGTGLASFLNGLFTGTAGERLFKNLGSSIAGAINAVLNAADAFAKKFNFTGLGKNLGSGLTEFLTKLDWKTALSAAKNWGKGIGDAIAGFVKKTDFELVGKTIANAIKTQVTFWLSLGSSIPWKDIGKGLADTINGAIEDFPAKDFADTIDVWVQGIYDAMTTAFKNLEWDDLKDKIKEFFGNLDWKTIKILVGGFLLVKGISFAVALSAELKKEFLRQVAKKIVGDGISLSLPKISLSIPSIVANIQNIAWTLPGTPVFDVGATALLEKLWNAIYTNMPKSWSSFYDKLDKFIKETVIGGFFNILETHLKKIFSWENTLTVWEDAKENFKKGGGYILAGIAEGLIAVPGFFLEPIGNLFKALWDDLCSVFGISSPAEKMKPIGKYIVQGIIEGFKLPDIKGATEDIKNKIFDIVGTAKSKFDEMKTDVGKKIGDLKTDAESKWGSFKTNIGTKMSDIKKNVSTGWSNIKSTTSNLVGGKDSILSKAREGFNNIKSSVKDKFDAKDGIKGIVSGAWTSIASTASKGIGGTKGDTILTKVGSAFDDVKEKISKIIGDIIGLVDFEWSFPTIGIPKIKKPHFTWSWKNVGDWIKVPTDFKVEWYAKAYSNPMLFTKPTLMPNMKGFGDGNGGEMVYGHANLMNDIREASGGNEMTNIGNRQLANDQRIIQLLTVIAEKEFGISADSIYSVVKEKDSDFFTRSGKSAFSY